MSSERFISVFTTDDAVSVFCAYNIEYFDLSDNEAVKIKENYQIYQNVFSFTNCLHVKVFTMNTVILY